MTPGDGPRSVGRERPRAQEQRGRLLGVALALWLAPARVEAAESTQEAGPAPASAAPGPASGSTAGLAPAGAESMVIPALPAPAVIPALGPAVPAGLVPASAAQAGAPPASVIAATHPASAASAGATPATPALGQSALGSGLARLGKRLIESRRCIPKELQTRRYSSYEHERICRALERVGGRPHPAPEGKPIESIEIVRLDIFEPEDPTPTFLNWFHTTTQQNVIERELLFRVGSRYRQWRSNEVERNLRSLFLFSVVVAVPLVGTTEDTVRYLLITKDLWSLRLGWDGRFNGGVIDSLSLRPSEINLFGTARRVYADLAFARRTFSVGAGYVEPRVSGSRLRIELNASAVINCKTGDLEGSSGGFFYSKPLYATTTPWSYSTSASWNSARVVRTVEGGLSGAICQSAGVEEVRGRLRDDNLVLIPNAYFTNGQSFSQTFTRSFGVTYKTNLSFGLEARRRGYSPVATDDIRPAPAAEDNPAPLDSLTGAQRLEALRIYQLRVIPRGETRISPFFQVTSFTTKFHDAVNSETLALQEDFSFRLGHIASLRLYPASKHVGSTYDLLGARASVSYAASIGTGYLKLAGSHNVELSSPERTAASASLALRFTSPRMALGRFVYDARLVSYYRNDFTRGRLWVGGPDRLRGHINPAAVGDKSISYNLEFRTRPVSLYSVQLAGVLFQDVGDAFDEFGEVSLKQGVGVGLRFLIPQFDRDVFRVDLGFPVPFDAATGETTVIATFGQAFGLP